jgi:hypothetical protein
MTNNTRNGYIIQRCCKNTPGILKEIDWFKNHLFLPMPDLNALLALTNQGVHVDGHPRRNKLAQALKHGGAVATIARRNIKVKVQHPG